MKKIKLNMSLDTREVRNFKFAFANFLDGKYQNDGIDTKERYNNKTLMFYEEDWEVEGDPDKMYELVKKAIERNLSEVYYSNYPEEAYEIRGDASLYVKMMKGDTFYRDIEGNRKTCRSWDEPCIVAHRHTGEVTY